MSDPYPRRKVSDESPSSLSGWLFADLFLLLLVVGFSQMTSRGIDERPVVRTLEVSNLQPGSATLNGEVTPKKKRTKVYFELSRSDNLEGAQLFVAEQSPVSGAEVTSQFQRRIEALEPGRTYYFRAVAKNEAGLGRGLIRSFTTDGMEPCSDDGPSFSPKPFQRKYTYQTVGGILDDIEAWTQDLKLVKPRVAVAIVSGWTTVPGGAGSIGKTRAEQFFRNVKTIDAGERFFYKDTALSAWQKASLPEDEFDVVLYFVDLAGQCDEP